MDIDIIYRHIQTFFNSETLIIVGSGLSCAEGIPGMGGLTSELLSKIPSYGISSPLWDQIAAELIKGEGLESVLLKYPPDNTLEGLIKKITTELIEKSEQAIINEVLAGNQRLKFSDLINRIPINNTLSVITTNYDRLVEIACNCSGIEIDNMFYGKYIAELDEKRSRMSFCCDAKLKNKKVSLEYTKRVRIFKPHGCLGWCIVNGAVVAVSLNNNMEKLIITPGLNKFRAGYEHPFDVHREKANLAIISAQRFLVIGYGFNDDHLETHLKAEIRKGKPVLVLNRSLTPNLMTLISQNTNITVLAMDEVDNMKTKVFHAGRENTLDKENLWDISKLIEEVL